MRCKVEENLPRKPYIIKKDHPKKIGNTILRYFYDAYPCNEVASNGNTIFTTFIKGYMYIHEHRAIHKNHDPPPKPPPKSTSQYTTSTSTSITTTTTIPTTMVNLGNGLSKNHKVLISGVLLFIVLCLVIVILITKFRKKLKTVVCQGLRQDRNMSNPKIANTPIVVTAGKNGM